jgi:hypothetical protein
MILFGLSLLSFVFVLIPWPVSVWQIIFGLVFITTQSQLIGLKYFRYKSAWFRWLLGFLLYISLIIIVGTVFFYSWNLSSSSLLLLSLLPSVSLLIPNKQTALSAKEEGLDAIKLDRRIFATVLSVLYILLAIYTVSFLLAHQVTDAIQSPWLALPSGIFVLYFLLTIIVIILNIVTSQYRVIINSLHFLLSFCLTLLLYPLGFGFDPFIHQATEKIIASTGTLSPKPFYYIGHYSLVVWLSHWLHLSLKSVDSWLVPVLAALSLPTIIFQAFKENFHNQSKVIQLLPLIFLTIPFGFLIQSTPQSLSVLLSLLIIFLALFYINRQGVSLWYIVILSLATLAIHPLSGIPVVFFSVLLGLYHRFWHRKGLTKYVRVIGYSSLTAIAAVILPLTFFLNSYLSRTTGSGQPITTTEATTAPEVFNTSYHNFVRIEDLIYFLGDNSRWLLLALSLVSLAFMIRKKRAHYFLHYLVTFLVLGINFILLKNYVSFDFLIPYERFIFPERILQLSFYFLLPFVFVTGYLLLRRIMQLPSLLQTICWIFFAGTITIAWYLSYPRFDFQEQNKGFSTSQYDIETVRWIHEHAKVDDYVVLANQSVSAAAIDQYGFYHYYGRNFYYPIPTGDPLYQSYLDLINNRKELSLVLTDVKNLTGAKTIYLVVNNYWSGFEDIVARNKKTANQTQVIGDEKNYIFSYQLP